MKNRVLLICILIVLSMAALTALVYPALPATITLHWDLHGRPNGFGPPAYLFGNVGLMAFVLLIWGLKAQLSPARFTVDSFAATYWRIGLLTIVFLAVVHCLLLWVALAPGQTLQRTLAGALAVFIGLAGNVMGKLRRNFWLGVRTPWTLASDRVWYATHRFAGRSMVIGALLSLAAVLAGAPLAASLGLVLAGVLAPLPYSLWLYKKMEGDGRLAQ